MKMEKRWIDFFYNENEPFIYVAINDTGKIIGFASGLSPADSEKTTLSILKTQCY
ncbi:hypothetical protein [Peribacillus sp. NPDC055009]